MSEDRRTRWITLLEAEIARRHAETLEAGGDPREQLLWITLLEAEIARRHAETLEAAGGDPREQLLAVLEQMGQRMRAAGDWIEPSADEKMQLSRVNVGSDPPALSGSESS